MSGYNNFSYFNGPTTTNEWWINKDSNKTFEEERIAQMNKQQLGGQWPKTVPYSDFNNQMMTQNMVQNYAQNVMQPKDSRLAEPQQLRHEVIQGTVTQLFSNFGYINDNIIFSKSDVMGQMVSVGDKVAVDATFQPNNPTKYKGERVCKMDDTRFNSVSNTTFKISSIPQPPPPRFDNPPTNRWDVKKVSQPLAARSDQATKVVSDNKNDYQVSSSSRHDTPSKNIVDTTQTNKALPIQIKMKTKTSLDKNSSSQSTSSRIDLTTTKNDSQTSVPRIDLTGRSRSDSDKRDSPRSITTSKMRSDGYKDDSHLSSSRSEISAKSRLGDKSEGSKRSDDSSSTRKRSSEKRKSRSKDKSVVEKDKVRPTDTKTRRIRTKRNQQLRKTEAKKRKAISPIKIQESPKAISSTKSVTESKSKCAVKNYENFALREMDCAAVKNQFKTLELPKEFFHISLKYQNSFPLNHPMKLGHNSHFKIMDKKVKSIDPSIDIQLRKEIDPKDADSTFVAKVMLLSTDDLTKFYKDTLTLAEEFEGENKIAITKAIKFLVGSVGENKEFAIGGAWSPSLDGPDPDTNPRVLINTAIRTCKAMTGVDLSNCSAWPKFLELHYYRPLQKKKGSSGTSSKTISDTTLVEEPVEYSEPRMETVVYYIPNVWNCVPSPDSWKEITRSYREQLTCIMCPPPSAIRPIGSAILSPGHSTTATSTTEAAAGASSSNNLPKKSADGSDAEEEDWNFNETEPSDDKAKNSGLATTDGELPTHFSKLIIAGMKIVDIKKELELRKQSTKGIMEQLKARLKAALDREEVDEKYKEIPVVVAPVVVAPPVPKSTLSDEEKNELKKLYVFPDRPEIIVHQNRKISGNQMKIRTMSLHSLLSYYDVKLNENTFELAVFAKQFLDMLRRDAVFNIYKSIVVADEADLINNEESAKKAKLMVTTSKRTVNRPLLFSCTLLDKEKTNKISLEDLKIFIEGLGICLSSDQLASVLAKVKDSSKYLNYRQLTDKEMTDTEIANLLNLDVNEDLDYIKELAMGNKALFDSEAVPMDISMNDDDEIERLKNELDKSERYRQSIEIKVSEMKDETKKNIDLVQVQAKEILRLKEQSAEFKAKYRSEQDRGSHCKNNYERLLRQVKDIDTMTASLNKSVSDTLSKHEALVTKKSDSKERTSSTMSAKKKPSKPIDKSKKTTVVRVDLTKSAVVSEPLLDASAEEIMIVDEDNVDMDHNTAEEVKGTEEVSVSTPVTMVAATVDPVVVSNGQTGAMVDEFELLKESDYDMISIGEVDIL